MCSPEKKRRKKTMEMNISWNNKKAAADREEPLLQREVDELLSWANAFECMDDVQLRKCVRIHQSAQNSPEKTPRMKQVHKSTVRSNLLQVQKTVRSRQPKCSSSLMAAVWKFHSEEEENSITASIT